MEAATPSQDEMKLRVARSVKWNAIDKIASMVLYSVTGIVLANVVPREDFGLVGAVAVFQAFAALFVDSGFSSALIQKKRVDKLDYSSVFWFNLSVSAILYVVLFLAAPWIAEFYQGDERLIPISRVMFLTFILNALAIVQTNRLMKRMDMKMITVSNTLGLIVSSLAAIWMALAGWGAWALVWQAIILAAVKAAILWSTGKWVPLLKMSWSSLRSFFRVGSGMMGGSFLNILFRNIYTIIIGHRAGILPLSYYTQADKWSTMGISSLSAMLTQSFLPALSEYQDDEKKFASSTAKMNRLTAYILFPVTTLLIVSAGALFHTLFETKWDDSVILFQLLLFRGVFTVIQAVYNNYILALGKARLIVATEFMRDIAAIIAIVITWGYIAIEKPDDVVYGITILLWGQIAASFLTWAVTLVISARLSKRPSLQYLSDLVPYAILSLIAIIPSVMIRDFITQPLLLVVTQILLGGLIYMGLSYLSGSKIQSDVLGYIFSVFNKKK